MGASYSGLTDTAADDDAISEAVIHGENSWYNILTLGVESVLVAIVGTDGLLLGKIPRNYRTSRVCVAAIENSRSALAFVPNPSIEMYRAAALKRLSKAFGGDNRPETECALRFIDIQTEEICIEAVRIDSDAARYVNNQTEAVCLAAVESFPTSVNWIRNRNQVENIYAHAIMSNVHRLDTLIYIYWFLDNQIRYHLPSFVVTPDHLRQIIRHAASEKLFALKAVRLSTNLLSEIVLEYLSHYTRYKHPLWPLPPPRKVVAWRYVREHPPLWLLSSPPMSRIVVWKICAAIRHHGC